MKSAFASRIVVAGACLLSLNIAQALECQNSAGQAVPCPPPSGGASTLGLVPFDLLPPGARSLGLGGAFTAVADDATASEANPAGITTLVRPEFSLSGRRTSFDLTNFNGDAQYADVYDGRPVEPFPLYNKSSDDTNAVSFASYVHPFENGAISLYYQNTGKIKSKSSHTAEATGVFDFFGFQNNVDLNAEALGFTGAYRLNDLLSVGASLRYSRLSLSALDRSSVQYFFDLEQQNDGSINTTGVTDFIQFERAVDDDDRDLTFNVGLLLNPGGTFSAGIVYKDGGSYTLTSTRALEATVSCTLTPTQDCGGFDQDIELVESQSVRTNTRIDLPDVLNIGFAFRPSDTWLLSFDIHHTRFGQLPSLPGESLLFGNPAPNAIEVVDTQTNRGAAVKRFSNATTYHFGVEHVFIFSDPMMMGLNSLALRAGAFSEPDLGTYSDDDIRGLPGVDTQDTHYTVGLGATFGAHVQVNLGAEFSEDTDNLVLSAIYRL